MSMGSLPTKNPFRSHFSQIVLLCIPRVTAIPGSMDTDSNFYARGPPLRFAVLAGILL